MIGIKALSQDGRNSTMFTRCCEVAICDSEGCCPKCGREVIGKDAPDDHARWLARWNNANQNNIERY